MLLSHREALSLVNHILLPRKVAHSRSLRQGKVHNRAILPLCHTTIPTRKINTTVRRTILAMEYHSLSLSTLGCSSPVHQALDPPLRPQLSKVPRPFRRNQTPTVRACTDNNIPRPGMMSLGITLSSTSTNIAMHRMLPTYLRMNMESINNNCMVPHKVCKASLVLDRAPDRLRVLPLVNALEVDLQRLRINLMQVIQV